MIEQRIYPAMRDRTAKDGYSDLSFTGFSCSTGELACTICDTACSRQVR